MSLVEQIGKQVGDVRASIVVPWRTTEVRAPVWRWLRAYYEYVLPGWEIVEGADRGGVPFSKPCAANEGASRAHEDVLVILDADVLVHADVIAAAVERVRAGTVAWSTPIDRAFRLDPARTALLLAASPRDFTWPEYRGAGGKPLRPWKHGAMIVVCRKIDFERIGGMDARLRGHCPDDSCLRASLLALVGPQDVPDATACGFHLHCADRTRVTWGDRWIGQERPGNMSLTWKYIESLKAARAGDRRLAESLLRARLAARSDT